MKHTLSLVASLLLTGCVSTNIAPLPADSTAGMAGKTLAYSTRKLPDFAAVTAGKAGFGMIGGAAMISAGNGIVKENQIEDPANFIRGELATALATSYNLRVIEIPDAIAEGSDVTKLAAAHKQADVLLDVQTVNWSFAYFPTDWNSYRVIYSVKLRLIETGSAKLLAEGFCARVPDKTPESPSRDQLLANGAERLKAELHSEAEWCVTELKSKVLNIEVPASAVSTAS